MLITPTPSTWAQPPLASRGPTTPCGAPAGTLELFYFLVSGGNPPATADSSGLSNTNTKCTDSLFPPPTLHFVIVTIRNKPSHGSERNTFTGPSLREPDLAGGACTHTNSDMWLSRWAGQEGDLELGPEPDQNLRMGSSGGETASLRTEIPSMRRGQMRTQPRGVQPRACTATNDFNLALRPFLSVFDSSRALAGRAASSFPRKRSEGGAAI